MKMLAAVDGNLRVTLHVDTQREDAVVVAK